MKRAIFIGQAMPRKKRNPHDWSSLNQWLYSIGLTDKLIKETTLYSALVDYFPGAVNGSHIVPTKEDIEKERDRLAKTIVDFKPELVVPIGRLSISYCLNQKVQPLINHIGKVYLVNPYMLYYKELTIIPLPHPSGVSIWKHKKSNQQLLRMSLEQLRRNIA
ncbi:hypothetical protein A2685_01275 [Candidatus Woesebacteria bacterium RIFCSPHIGHO2_01_FULL_37_10]|uniref:Uracil-DNA glycosylase-like domain-containing protein n=1 Tax=Candidatus Woesebacteria bacterium RIFCSPHIGHO2_01_FULL_37_10 TaxID=1802489 RepID=A0A1F7XX09_9BACT|nr:MAG: hypothetical protein A2685_01275 [Candidatus Woesebacteria bacterium RIFCSPHIGHO2_01_FULL_37_10]